VNVSAPFQTSIKFIFENFDDGVVYFSNTIRSLLVDNIVQNLHFITKDEIRNFKKLDFKHFIQKQNQIKSQETELQPQNSYETLKNDYLKSPQGSSVLLFNNVKRF